MFDTHAHVHDAAFDADREDVVRRAKAAGVDQVVTVGCDIADSRRALETAAEFGLRASIGIHPHEAQRAPPDIEAAFDSLLSGPVQPVAIGETGLDYYYDHSPREAQAAVVRAQIHYARKRRCPLIFHQRDAFDDFVAILREEFSAPLRGVVHCFTGDAQQARTFVGEFGLLLGIGGVMTFKNAAALREAIALVGLGSLVLETDAPYLAPVPHRGARNEPAFVAHTARALAELLGERTEAVIERTTANAIGLFGHNLALKPS